MTMIRKGGRKMTKLSGQFATILANYRKARANHGNKPKTQQQKADK